MSGAPRFKLLGGRMKGGIEGKRAAGDKAGGGRRSNEAATTGPSRSRRVGRFFIKTPS